MHIGHTLFTQYYMDDNWFTTELSEIIDKKDLGVLRNKN